MAFTNTKESGLTLIFVELWQYKCDDRSSKY